ncbi:MAG: hypothetical protein ABL901_11580 [Hyphomicrobiaceae bacterium]
MKKLHTLGMGAVVATAAFSLFALTANAQQPAPVNPAVVAPVKPAAPPAAAKPATAPAVTTPAAAAKPKTPAKAASACKGLDETGCKANAECNYVVPAKADAKTGKVDKPYCRKVAGVAVKKPAAAPATAPAAAKAAAPATPKAAAPAAPKANAPAPATKQ